MSTKEYTKNKKNLYTMTITDDEWLGLKSFQETDRVIQLPEEFMQTIIEDPFVLNVSNK